MNIIRSSFSAIKFGLLKSLACSGKKTYTKVYLQVFIALALSLPLNIFSQPGSFVMPADVKAGDYIEGRIIFKVKPGVSEYIKANGDMPGDIRKAITDIEGTDVKRRFPRHTPPATKYNESGFQMVDLSLIHYLDIPGSKDLEAAINRLYKTGLVEYAQPKYIPGLLQHYPDDPRVGSQYYLEKIRAFDAWDIARGDTNTVIGIIDTGTDLEHPDLINNIKYNYHDPLNGEDSDNDGFIDNYYGWDFGENNNMPQYNANAHGVHVSGIAAASANNGTGIAGTGYNSKFLPVKIDDEYGRLVMSYEGIVYAADRRASVINCSWGGRIGAGPYGEDIVNYALINRDALVVGAGGNSDNQVPIYPAAYENVFSVAATDEHDIKAGFSSYGITIDASAPGKDIISTYTNASYMTSPGGTSMAAPIVSGAAAILRSHFPDYNAMQIAEQLKVTADNIDTVQGNENYKGLLGTGRINLYRALTDTLYPSLKLVEHKHSPDEYSLYNAGDTMNVSGSFINFLAPSDNIEVTVSSSSEYVEIIDSVFTTGAIGKMERITNNDSPFKIRLKDNIPINQNIQFKLAYNDNLDYKSKQYFSVIVNIDYILIDTNRITTTLTSRGTLGYNYPDYQQGVGFLFEQDRSLIECAGLITGKSTSNVVDNIYGAAEDSFNNWFIPVNTVRKIDNQEHSDLFASGSFKDDPDNPYGLNIQVDQYAYAWAEPPKDKFIILEYDIINKGDENISSFYAGFFADWVINDVKQHRASVDEETRMGYAYSATGGYYTGVSLISKGQFRYYTFDNEGFGGSIKISDGFTNFEKYTALKGNRSRAGVYDADNSVSTLVSTGPYNINPNDTLKIAFGIIAGDHRVDMQTSAKHAYDIYHGVDDDENGNNNGNDNGNDTVNFISQPYNKDKIKFNVYPNPVSEKINIDLEVNKPQQHIIRLLDIQGNIISVIHEGWMEPGVHNISYNMSSANNNYKVMILQIITKKDVINKKILKALY